MKRVMLAFAVISVSGCLCAKECKTNEDCATGQVCGSQNLCETPSSVGGGAPGGGTAGGSVAGGAAAGGSAGGMVTAGGPAGGSTAGGVAGGVAGGAAGGSVMGGGTTAGGAAGGTILTCPSGCMPFQECVAGQCVNGALEVLFPAEAMPHPAGAPLGVAARLRSSDGGLWTADVEIPFVASWGRTGLLPNDGGIVAVAVPPNPTSSTIAIGWTDGGPGPVTRSIVFLTCSSAVSAACEQYERCVPNFDGGMCKPFEMVLSWVNPSPGLARGPAMANVPVELTVAVDGGPLPAFVPVRFDGGLVATANRVGTTSTYTAPDIQFSTALARDGGPQGLVAGWPMPGPSVTRSFNWDPDSPVLTIRVQPPPTRPGSWPLSTVWRKDEVAQIEVRSNEALSLPATLEMVGGDGGVTRVGTNAACSGGCPQTRCDCFEVDFAQIPLNGVTGTVGFTVRGQDLVSNSTSVADSVQVTRLKWQTSVAGLSGAVEPALDVAGNLYVGGASTTTTGIVAQVLRDGGVGWTQTAYGAVTAPIVWSSQASLGDAGVFVATKTTTQAQIRALDAMNGAVADNGPCITPVAATTYSARMVSLGSTVVTARENGSNQQFAFIADPSSGTCSQNSTVFLTGKATLVGRGQGGGATEVFGASTGIAGFFRLTTNTSGTNWTGTTDSLPNVFTPMGGLALGGGRSFLTPASATLNGVFAHNLASSVAAAFSSGSTLAWTGASLGQPSTTVDAYFASPAGTTAGELYKTTLTLASNAFSPNTQMLANRGPFSPTNNSFSPAHAPILGQGSLVYTVSTNGDVSVFNTAGVWQWAATAGETSFGTTSVPPLLDVARNGNGGPRCDRPGILYVVSNSGTVTALVVDSAGLDTSAAWPRFQHDNANSGNADTSLSPWGCP